MTDAGLPRRAARRRFFPGAAGAVGLGLSGALGLLGLLAGRISPGDPRAGGSPTFSPPSWEFLMGTNHLGRQLFPQVLHGLATTLTVVVSVLVMSVVIALAVGALSGYCGGIVDSVLMRVLDMVQSVPRFLLAIVVAALFGPRLQYLILLLGLTSWTFLARIVRAEVLSVRRREFVEASRAVGSSGLRTLSRHVLPHVIPAVVVVVPLLASRLVLIEASLAFLGLGDPSRISLGYLLAEAQPNLQYYWWLSVFPGLVLVAMVLGFNLLGDAFNEALNPQRTRADAPVARKQSRNGTVAGLPLAVGLDAADAPRLKNTT